MSVRSRNNKSSRREKSRSGGKSGGKGEGNTAQWVLGGLVVIMILGGLANLLALVTDGGGVIEIDIEDKTMLKEVFYGGEPWVVMCDDANEDYLKFFSKSAAKLRDKSIRSGIMDCKSKLPTGESAKKRFKLKRSVGDPMVIYAANSRKPRQVPKSELEGRSVKSFTDFIRKKTQATMYGPITKKNDWSSRCLKSKACVTLYSGKDFSTDLRYLQKLPLLHRDIQFVYMNSSQYRVAVGGKELKFGSALQGTSMSLFAKEKTGPGEENRLHYFYQEDFDVDSIDNILQSYKTGRLSMALLDKDARISLKRRKSKKSKAEREAAAKKKKNSEERKAKQKADKDKEFRRKRRARIKAERDAKREEDAAAKTESRKASDDDDDEYEDEDLDPSYYDNMDATDFQKWKEVESEHETTSTDEAEVEDEESRREREARARARMAAEEAQYIPEEIDLDDDDYDDDDDSWMMEDSDDDDDAEEIEL